jgi:hypothetical protein
MEDNFLGESIPLSSNWLRYITETGAASLSKGRICFTDVSTTADESVSTGSVSGTDRHNRNDMRVVKITERQI